MILNSMTKADNLHFLSAIEEKEIVKCIYIDPPFTANRKFKNKNGEFAFSDVMSDEEFLEFLRVRVELAYPILREDGFFFLHIDNKIGHYVKVMLDSIFGKENFVTNIITARVKKNDKNNMNFNESFDHLFLYRKKNGVLKPLYKPSNKKPYWHSLAANSKGDGKWFGDKFIECEGHWRWSQERINKAWVDGTLRLNKNGKPEYLVNPEKVKIDNNWMDFGYSFKHGYPTEKHPEILRRVIECSTEEDDIVMDFFAGSGTTLAVGLEMNRKVVGCDIGELSFKTIQKRLPMLTFIEN